MTDSEVPLPRDVCACEFPHREKLPSLVENVLAEMERRSSLEHICRDPLPNVESVAQILRFLGELMFPGYFTQKALDRANLPYHVGETAAGAFDLLWQEIARCLMHERRRCGPAARRACEEEAMDQAFKLMQHVPDIMRMLDGDVEAGYSGDPAATGREEVLFSYPGFRAVMVHRIAHRLHSQGVRWLPRMMTEYAHGLTGIDIHPGAAIGERFFIDHGTGVVIGETTEIGNDVRLYQGVTLGAWSFKKDEAGHLVRGYKRHPTIGDGVIVYSSASVLGPVTIGAGSVIGANAMVTENVPPNSVVSIEQSPPRVKQRK